MVARRALDRHDPEQAGPAPGGDPADVREHAFQVWLFVADRNPKQTLAILQRDRPEDHASGRLPCLRTLQRWVVGTERDEPWDRKGNRLLAELAPQLHASHVARLFQGRDRMLTEAWGLATMDPGGSPGMAAVKRDAVFRWLELSGLGTAGARTGDAGTRPTADRGRPPGEPRDEDLDPNERARRLRDRITKDNRGRR